MSITIESLEMSVQNLPPSDLTKFRQWFVKFDTACWDAQIECDTASGKLNSLEEEESAEYRAGKAREL